MSDDDPTWDETTRPTLAEPGDAPYSATQLATADHLVQVHDHLRSELERLQGLVDEVRRGMLSAGEARAGVQAMTIRQNNWTLGAYCQSYCGFVNGHHTLEDASVFPTCAAPSPASARWSTGSTRSTRSSTTCSTRSTAPWSTWSGTGTSRPWPRLDATIGRLVRPAPQPLAYEERELRGPLARHGFY